VLAWHRCMGVLRRLRMRQIDQCATGGVTRNAEEFVVGSPGKTIGGSVSTNSLPERLARNEAFFRRPLGSAAVPLPAKYISECWNWFIGR
jgi:hypothetical protein